jgi:hypothetical protein
VERTVNQLVSLEALAGEWIRIIGVAIDVFGVIVIVGGIVWATMSFLNLNFQPPIQPSD